MRRSCRFGQRQMGRPHDSLNWHDFSSFRSSSFFCIARHEKWMRECVCLTFFWVYLNFCGPFLKLPTYLIDLKFWSLHNLMDLILLISTELIFILVIDNNFSGPSLKLTWFNGPELPSLLDLNVSYDWYLMSIYVLVFFELQSVEFVLAILSWYSQTWH